MLFKMKRNTILACLLFFISVMFLCSCSVHQPNYPKDWPALVPPNFFECNNLAGEYKNPSEMATEHHSVNKQYKPTIEFLLGGLKLAEKTPSFTILFSEDQTLNISIIDDSMAVIKSFIYAKNEDYFCRNAYLEIDLSEKIKSKSESAGGYKSKKLLFYKNKDGSLIAHDKENILGYWGFIPMSLNDYQWLYFKKRN